MRPSDTLRDDPGQLAVARAGAGLSVSELARRLEVSRTAVQKWEAGSVPADRLAAVCAALDDPPPPAVAEGSALEQLAALVAAEPGLTEARLQARARHLATALDDAEQAGVLHRSRVTVQDANGRRYSRVLVLPGPRPEVREAVALTGHDVAGLRHLHGWSQDGLAKRLGVTRQRVADLERSGVPDGRQEQLRRLLVDPLPQLDLAATRRRSGLTQAELARRLGKQGTTVNVWERGRRPLPLAEAVRVGHVLAAAVDDEDPVEQAAARVAAAVARAQPEGLTGADLTRELGRGRARVPGRRAQYDQPGLELAVRRRQVHWRQTYLRSANGRWRTSPRLHTGPRRRLGDEQAMSGTELARARNAASISQSELAAGLGTVWGTVSKWERRGRRPIPPAVTAAARDVLEHLGANRPDRRAQAHARLLAAAAAAPGATRRELLVAAGYGRANPTALEVLEDLVSTGVLHLRPTANRGGAGSHQGVHPGAAPPDALPAALPGEQLRRLRHSAGLHQHDLAALVGVTQTAVAHWERGTAPSLRVAAVLAALQPTASAVDPLAAKQLRRARQHAGLSQEALGDALGVTGPAVSRWERVGVPRRRTTDVRRALASAS